jgi:hypothetical protein
MNKHSDVEHDETLMRAARTELEQGAETLDAVTLARLRAARARALDTGARQRLPGWLPAGAVALLMIAVMAGVYLQAPPAADDTVAMMSTLDDDYELYENLEFYEWLEAETDEKHV